MTNARPLDLSAPPRDARPERLPRAGVREERLRASAGLTGMEGMTSWRGRSGRRYVVGVHPSGAPDIDEVSDAVVLAVRRGRDGAADLLDVAAAEPGVDRRSRQRWLGLMRVRGATEIHVHLLAESETERAEIRRDLAIWLRPAG